MMQGRDGRDNRGPRPPLPSREPRFERGMDREQPRFEQTQVESREPKQLSQNETRIFREISGALIGTRGAYLFDEKLNVLGKVPLAELQSTLKSLNNVYAIVLDGSIDRELAKAAEMANVKCVVAMDSKLKPDETRLAIATISEL